MLGNNPNFQHLLQELHREPSLLVSGQPCLGATRACTYFGVGPETLLNWAGSGKVQVLDCQGERFVSRGEIARVLTLVWDDTLGGFRGDLPPDDGEGKGRGPYRGRLLPVAWENGEHLPSHREWWPSPLIKKVTTLSQDRVEQLLRSTVIVSGDVRGNVWGAPKKSVEDYLVTHPRTLQWAAPAISGLARYGITLNLDAGVQ